MFTSFLYFLFSSSENLKMNKDKPICEIVEYNGTRYTIIEVGCVVEKNGNHQTTDISGTNLESTSESANKQNKRKQSLAKLSEAPTMQIKRPTWKPIKRVKPEKEWKYFMCSICNTFFATIQTYRKHCQISHSKNDSRIKCKFCDQFFLLNHIEDHLAGAHKKKKKSPAEKLIHCEYCGKGYNRKHFLVQHIFEKHQKVAIQCDHCFRFLGEDDLPKHIKDIHGNNTKFLKKVLHLTKFSF